MVKFSFNSFIQIIQGFELFDFNWFKLPARGSAKFKTVTPREGENGTGKLHDPPLALFFSMKGERRKKSNEEKKREECTTNPEERECMGESLDRVYCYTPFVFECK